MKRSANSVDGHVGERLRARRITLGMSQSKLGQLLGVTFQQIQKYEKGANRISAVRLGQAAQALETTINYFLAGVAGEPARQGSFAEPEQPFDVSFLSTGEGWQLNRAFSRIRDPKVRRRVLDLVISLAPPDDETDESVR